LKTQTRSRVVKDVLTQKGVNAKVAAFIPQDLEPSEEAITNWLNEYGDVFGVTSPDAAAPDAKAQAQTPDLNAQTRINNVVNTGMPTQPDEDAMAKILNATSAEELSKILGINAL